jgi:glycosyltransferase involved in cell wall biosynthesis
MVMWCHLCRCWGRYDGMKWCRARHLLLEGIEGVSTTMVSVIIPTYNRAHVISRAIGSVLSQTYQDFEIIVVDDGSTDNTEDVVRSFKDTRVNYIGYKENRGANAAKNVGVRAARGDSIGVLDSDDEYLPERLEKTVHVLRDSSADIGVVYSNLLINRRGRMKKYLTHGISGNIYAEELKFNYIPTCTAIVKKQCLLENPYDEKLPAFVDWDLWIRLAKHYKFIYVDEPLSIWHCDSEERISRNIGKIVAANKIFLEKYADDIVKYPKVHARFLYSIGHGLCRLRDVKNGRRYLLQSLKHYPLRTQSVMALTLSLLGPTVYDKIVKVRQFCQR